MDLTKVSLNDLHAEIERRKKEEAPNIVEELNGLIDTLGKLGIKLRNRDDENYFINNIRYDEDSSAVSYYEVEETY